MELLCNQCWKDPQQIDGYGKTGQLEGKFLEDGKLWCKSHYFEKKRREK